MRASTVPTSTVSPTCTSSAATRPEAGDGTSVSTLSVEISTIGSSFSIQSPTRFFHSTTVPSATETPICGIVTSTSVTSVGEELTACLLDVAGLGQDRALERRRERDRRVGSGDPHDRSVEVLEAALADQGGHLGADPARARGLVQHHDLARLAHRREDRLLVERAERAQVDHLDRRAFQIGRRLERQRHHLAVCDHAEIRPLARDASLADRRLVAPLGHLALRAAVEVLVLHDSRGLGSRIAAASRPLASSGVDGATTFRPGDWRNHASGFWEWYGPPEKPPPDGRRTTIGTAMPWR